MSLGSATLTTGGDNTSTTFSGALGVPGSTGGLTKTGTGTMTLSGFSFYTGATNVNGGVLQAGAAGAFARNSAFGVGSTLDLNNFNQTIGSLAGTGLVKLGSATLITGGDNTSTTFSGSISGTSGSLSKIGSGTMTLSGTSTYSGPTFVSDGVLRAGATGAFAPNSAFGVGSTLDLNNFNQTIGSLFGPGLVKLGSATLTTGGDNTSTTFDGSITGTGGLTKTGSGAMTLSGINTYTGATTVNNGGALEVNGSIATSSLTTANSGALLTGVGTIGNTQINAGGVLAPGRSAPPGASLTVAGNLTFQSGANYNAKVAPSTASFTNVTGTATLGGATAFATFVPGVYMTKTYTILTAAGGLGGTTFGSLVNSGLSANLHDFLSYDSNNVFLNLVLDFALPPTGGLNQNQQAVANAITGFFNTNGVIPTVFSGLTPAGLTQASGEGATASQQTTFNAMSQFMGLLTDPFMRDTGCAAGGLALRDRCATAAGGATGYADEGARGAYAMFDKAPPVPFQQRWSVWAAGFGGSQTTNGNDVVGSNHTTSRIYGTAVGADYLLAPTTLAGFALAGGGTNFGVDALGGGRSDLFQAGAYVHHTVGPAYVTAALAYGWQDVTTDRTLTIAGIDHLRAEFNANAWSGRIEGGYRFVAPWIGVGLTPYAAGQATTFELPAYAEQVVVGGPAFALNYAAREATDARSELGLRADKSFAQSNGVLTLRGRLAWAHDYDPDRFVGATFQALPGASFVVNGATQARDSALTTASAEMKWLNGWSAAATFEGEFSDVTRSYAGKGVLRYAW